MRLCLFSSFFMSRDIPKYVRHYLIELQRHFDSIVFLNNDCKQLSDASLEWLKTRNILNHPVKNEGYDFGMWAKFIRNVGVDNVTELALVNDSCVQFAPLDEFINWSRNSKYSVCGLTDSNVFSSYHLQSYFLIVKEDSISDVSTFISGGEITENLLQTIHQYEMGLSQFLKSKNHSFGALFSVKSTGYDRDLMAVPFDLINEGLPMIKKKLIYGGPMHKQAAIILYSQARNLDLIKTLKDVQHTLQIDNKKMGELFDFNAISSADRDLKLGVKDRLIIFKRRYLNPLLGIYRFDKVTPKYNKQ